MRRLRRRGSGRAGPGGHRRRSPGGGGAGRARRRRHRRDRGSYLGGISSPLDTKPGEPWFRQLVKKPRRVRGTHAANEMKSVFDRDMCVVENTSRPANVQIVRHRRTICALRQAATRLSEKAQPFSTASRNQGSPGFDTPLAYARQRRLRPRWPQVKAFCAGACPAPDKSQSFRLRRKFCEATEKGDIENVHQ